MHKTRSASNACLKISGQLGCQRLGEIGDGVVEVEHGGVLQSLGLRGDRVHDVGVAVAAAHGGDARERVQVAPPVLVVQVLPLPLHDVQLQQDNNANDRLPMFSTVAALFPSACRDQEPVRSKQKEKEQKKKKTDKWPAWRPQMHLFDPSTYRVGVEVEEGRAEVLGALAGDVGGAGPVVGQRDVVERRHSRRRRIGRGRGGETGEPPHQTPSRPQLHHRLATRDWVNN